MKLCDTCIYRNNVEQLKPCIIYRDDCEYYEREEDMKAIIQIDVPDYQIGQEVSIYFKDTMMIKGIVQEPCNDAISRQAVLEWCGDINMDVYTNEVKEFVIQLPSVNPQEPKTGRWIGHREHCENLGVMPSGLGAYKWCSNCDCGIDVKEWHRNNYNYCPNCGARMESEDKE